MNIYEIYLTLFIKTKVRVATKTKILLKNFNISTYILYTKLCNQFVHCKASTVNVIVGDVRGMKLLFHKRKNKYRNIFIKCARIFSSKILRHLVFEENLAYKTIVAASNKHHPVGNFPTCSKSAISRQ